MKKCLYCAEEIQDKSIVCHYCGRDLPKEIPGETIQENPKVEKRHIGIAAPLISGALYTFYICGSLYQNLSLDAPKPIDLILVDALKGFVVVWLLLAFLSWVNRYMFG